MRLALIWLDVRMPDAYFGHLEKVQTGLWIIVGSLLLLLGCVGNVLVIILVSVRPSVKSSTNALHLACLAAADLSVLFVGMLRHVVIHISDINIRDLSSISCKLHIYVTYVCHQMSACILVHLTVERVIAVFLAHRVHLLVTTTRAQVALALNLCIVLAINTPYLCSFTLVPIYLGNQTKLMCSHHSKWTHMSNTLDWVHLCVSSAVPFCIMAVANSAIVVKVYRNRRESRHLVNRQSGCHGDPTRMLVTVTSAFIVTTAPYAIYVCLVNNMRLFDNVSDARELAQLYMVGTVMALLSYVNNAINFVFYCLLGSRFRNEAIALFRRNRVTPVPNSCSAVRKLGTEESPRPREQQDTVNSQP